MHIIKWKKPIRKDYILYDYNYVTFRKRLEYGLRKKVNGYGKRGGRGRMKRRSTEDF